ncbi:MAG: hypothetical protein P0S95_06130 [Rhabdochlamydiaceae bacterium]|nr:hypothetical protein [Candidatus Amphrikana amoebophyrae]
MAISGMDPISGAQNSKSSPSLINQAMQYLYGSVVKLTQFTGADPVELKDAQAFMSNL